MSYIVLGGGGGGGCADNSTQKWKSGKQWGRHGSIHQVNDVRWAWEHYTPGRGKIVPRNVI